MLVMILDSQPLPIILVIHTAAFKIKVICGLDAQMKQMVVDKELHPKMFVQMDQMGMSCVQKLSIVAKLPLHKTLVLTQRMYVFQMGTRFLQTVWTQVVVYARKSINCNATSVLQ